MIKSNFSTLVCVLSMFALCLVSFSCGDDLPADQQANDDLNGSWLSSSFIVNGTEALGASFTSLELSFVKSGDINGTFTAITTSPTGTPSTSSSTYDVVDEGTRIKIGTDTLDMSVSSSSLNLEGRVFFSSGNAVEITATKQ